MTSEPPLTNTPDDLDDPRAWITSCDFTDTSEVEVPEQLMDQIIGQDDAVEIAKQAAEQRRHLLLIGEPGTGKSMLAKAMAECLPEDDLEDVLVYGNRTDANEPLIRTAPAGKGHELYRLAREETQEKALKSATVPTIISMSILALFILGAVFTKSFILIFYGIIGAAIIFFILRMGRGHSHSQYPQLKVLVNHQKKQVPFVDATSTHSGALLGDVRHDPFQSGGMETPAHFRVEPGAIHRAHKGILYIDEVNTLTLGSQQHLLTAMQDKKFQITGQSERSSGALVKTEPVPCNFILVAAGNLDAIQGIHPALRSRVRGYGYEIFVKDTMPDTAENRHKLIRFVAQEVGRDGNIPHFTRDAVGEILYEAQRRAGRRGQLTLCLRDLGGVVRVAGDFARKQDASLVTIEHVHQARTMARTLEHQIVDRQIQRRKAYNYGGETGAERGQVNGLAVLGAHGQAPASGMVMPIVAEVTPAINNDNGQVHVTGKLGEIAKEAITNIAAVLKKASHADLQKRDVHVQFLGTYDGVEGDSASVSIATAVTSSLHDIPVRQDVAMTGSLSVHGKVLPVGGVTAKIEAAAAAGIKTVLVPAANRHDVLLDTQWLEKVNVVYCETIQDVFETALLDCTNKDQFMAYFKQ